MSDPDLFLSLYKEYEQLLRCNGNDARSVEDNVALSDPMLSDRLRLCRQFRNYMSHVSDPGFVSPTDKMIRFLGDRVQELKSAGDVVGKHLKKPDVCMVHESDCMQSAFDRFGKLRCFGLIVLRDNGKYGLLSVFDSVGKKASDKVGSVKLKSVKPKFCKPLDEYASVDKDSIWLCTDDGTSGGKLLGRVWVADSGGIC